MEQKASNIASEWINEIIPITDVKKKNQSSFKKKQKQPTKKTLKSQKN